MMRLFLLSALFLTSFWKAASLEVIDSNHITYDIPSFEFGSQSKVSFRSTVARERFLPNVTSLVHVTALMFPIQEYVDRCQAAGCRGLILYTDSDLQAVLEIAAWTEPVESASIPVVALGRTDVDLSKITETRFLTDSAANRFGEANQSRALIMLMNAVFFHRIINTFYCIYKLVEFIKSRSKIVYPILVIISYVISGVIGIVAFESLSLHGATLLSFRGMMFLMMLDALVLYCGRIAMGMNLAASRTKTMSSKTYSFDAIKDHITALGFIIAVGAAASLCTVKVLPSGFFTLLLFVITLPHIIFIAFNARNTGSLVNLLISNGRTLSISDEQRRIRMSFAWKAFGATVAGLVTVLLQVLFIFLQSWGPFEFVLLYSLQAFSISQVAIYTVMALKPAVKSSTAPGKQSSQPHTKQETAARRVNSTTTNTVGTAQTASSKHSVIPNT